MMETMTREQDRPLACGNARLHNWINDASSKIVKIVPDGLVESKRGTFTIDAAVAKRIIDAFHAHGVELPIDFDHAVVTGEPGEAKAVEWITELEYVPGEGIYARVDWREVAREAIRNRAYQYLSPAFALEHGEITELDSAALTNKPAIPRMEKLAASTRGASGDNREVRVMTDATMTDMEAVIGKIAALLKVAETGDLATLVQAILDALNARVTDGTLELSATKGAKAGTRVEPHAADGVVANAARSVLGLNADAGETETLVALGKVCHAAMVEKDRVLKLNAIIEPYIRKGVLDPNSKYATIRANAEEMIALAAANPDAFHTVMRERIAMAPPLGRTTPPTPTGENKTQRATIIRNAVREFQSDPGHARMTTAQKFANLALMDAGEATLHSDEMGLVAV